MKVVGCTACPSGVAHTYMAAEALKKFCKKNHHECYQEKNMVSKYTWKLKEGVGLKIN